MRVGRGVVAALLIAFASACAGSGTDTGPEAAPPPEFDDAAVLVATMRSAWDDAGTVSWWVRGKDLHDWGWAETGEGRQQRIWGMDSAVRRADGSLTRPRGPRALRTNQIACRSIPQPTSRQPHWDCTYNRQLFDLVVKLEYARHNPSRWVPALQEAAGLEELGESTVMVPAELDGATTRPVTARHYRFDAVTAPGLPAAPVDVWLDAEDRPLRMSVVEPQHIPPVRTIATFFDYGGKVDLTPPPRTSMSDWLVVEQAINGPRARQCMLGRCPPLEIGPPSPRG